jgi:hypothetical protein
VSEREIPEHIFREKEREREREREIESEIEKERERVDWHTFVYRI